MVPDYALIGEIVLYSAWSLSFVFRTCGGPRIGTRRLIDLFVLVECEETRSLQIPCVMKMGIYNDILAEERARTVLI